MSDISSISAKARELTGKGPARRLRVDGRMPAIVYGGVGEPVQLSLNLAEFGKEFRRPGFFTRLFDLNVDDDTLRVLPRDVQLHPVTDAPLHADFLRYVKGAQIAVFVGVRFEGQEECEGLKRGGVINIVRHEIELLCPVESIPDTLVADISALQIGDSLHISAIELPEGVTTTITDRDFTVATIAAPTVHVEEEVGEGEEDEEGVEGAEGAAAEEGGGGEAQKDDSEGSDS
ncbi:MAG: 50S ribosomal protein L25/general stress protein Ctc [Proteobacteria bacterium]|nr:50S ribosomal protein L25/general stress protein Ctc [Pseudomonadota bacterium]MDA1354776.1 50S ribosomal protein L25/general stress protein Ctc [Pseudomonadota bacterium]